MAPGKTASCSLRIYLLGRFQVSVEGQVLSETAIKGRKARTLLKLTALQRRGRIVRDRAMETLWPNLEEEAAASQLYKALHHIRKALGAGSDDAADWIEMTDELIRIDPPGGLEVDAHEFEQSARAGLRDDRTADLETAASLYAGDLLPMDLYAEWASLPREHYRQLYVDVLTALATRYEQRGSLSEAAQMLRLAIEKDPALESAHRDLMRIFARQGQPTRAFRQYDLCREMLRSELGTGPSRETKAVLESVREQRQSRPEEASGVRATTPRPTPPLVGRVSEVTTVDHLLDGLETGAGGTLLVRGGMGTGKTRLLQEVIHRARSRNVRVYACSAEEESEVGAYGPFVELFDEVLREHPDLEELLPEELGELMPRFSGNGAPVPHADRLAARGYLFAQVQRFLARLAEGGPLVLAVDDLDAADETSRELFGYLSRHGEDVPVLLVGTTRKEEAGPLTSEPSMREQGSTTVLNLAPLTADDHAALLRQRAEGPIPERLAERIYELSEGNPLFALELLRARREGGSERIPTAGRGEELDEPASPPAPIPPSLRRTIDREREELSAPARRLIEVAAVLGRRVPYELLAALWKETDPSEQDTLFDPLDEVLNAGWLEERGLNYAFRHTLVREAIYASTSEPRRRTLHAAAGRTLASPDEQPERKPLEQIGHHFARAGRVRQAVPYLIRAGRRAESVYAHEDALRLYRRTLSVLEDLDGGASRRRRREVLERMGDVYRACGRLEESYDAYAEAAALAEEMPMSESERVELHRKIALVAIFRTEMDRSEKHLERAFELTTEDDTRARARLLVTRALRLWHLNQLEEAYDVARDALARAKRVDADVEVSQAREILAMTCLPLGRWEEGLEYEMKRKVPGWSPEIVVATDAHLCLWEYHLTGDQPFERAQSFMQQVAEQAAELGDLRCVAVCHYALGTVHTWRGEREAALEELDQSLELHDQVGSPAGRAYTLARKAVLHTAEGTTDRGWRAVRDGIAEAERAAVRDHSLQRLYGVGIWNRLEAGDPEAVRELVEESQALLEDAGACGACSLELYPWLAYVHLRSGDLDRARACGETVAELTEMTGNPVGEAMGAMIASSLHAAEQESEQARTLRSRAFDLAEDAVEAPAHSPVVRYLDRMADHQEELHQERT